MSNDSESHIHYLQTPDYSPNSAVLQRETPQRTLPTLKAKLGDRRFNKKLKRIRENRYTEIVNQCSKEETSTILDYSPFMLKIIGKKNELIVKKNEEIMNKISLKYSYIKDWIESSANQGKCILPIIFDKADFYTNCPGLGTPIEVLERWLNKTTESNHDLFGIKYSILLINYRKSKYMKPYFMVKFMLSLFL